MLRNKLWGRLGALVVGLGLLVGAVMGWLAVAPPAARSAVSVNVLTQENDNARTGQNLNETTLNTTNVNSRQFGKLFSRPVNGYLHAQPLYVSNLALPGQGTHNVVIVATMHNEVYAYDADDLAANTPLWHTALEQSVPVTDFPNYCGDIQVEIGILSTPVIDLPNKTIYLVTFTKDNSGNYFHKLHALDLLTGLDKTGSPVTISGSVSQGGAATNIFHSLGQLQRVSLLLLGNTVYFAFSGSCDQGAYSGWVMGYDTTSLQQTAIFNTATTGNEGGIWQAGRGLAADSNSNIYFMSGNGTYSANTGGPNYGNSFVRLAATAGSGVGYSGIKALDYFTPFNQDQLNQVDEDLGSGGILLLPGSRLAVGGGKEGKIYVVDTANMGHYNAQNDNQIVQSFQATGVAIDGNHPIPNGATHHIHGSPIYWNGPNGPQIYVWGENDYLRSYKYNPTDASTGTFQVAPVAVGGVQAPGGMPGGMLSISANGNTAGTGIVWASLPTNGDAQHATVLGTLHAFDASNIAVELWNSDMIAVRDSLGNFPKFADPTIANGKVYMPTFSGQLVVYGLLPPAPPTIVTQPSDQVINSGQTATLSVLASSVTDGPFYQWYQGASGDTSSPVAGATSASFTTPVLTTTTRYWVKVSNSIGATNSSAATVSVNTPPVITTQPQNQTITSGQKATLSVVATATVVPVNISINAAGGPSGRFITDTYVTGGNIAPPVSAPIDTSQVTNPAPTLVYQTERWGQFSYNIPGFAPGASYTVRLHFCENVKNGVGQRLFSVKIQNQLVLNNFDIYQTAGGQHIAVVEEFPAVADASGMVNIQFQPTTADNPLVDGVEVLSNASTPLLTYQWYQGTSGDTSNPIAGATSISYTTPALTSTTLYWVQVSDSAGSVNSATAAVSIQGPPVIVTQPQSQTINPGQTANLTVAVAAPTGVTYQWYAGVSGDTSNPIGGATSMGYTTPALNTSASYWVRATNNLGHTDSQTANVYVTAPPVITQQPQSQTVVTGTSATLNVAATGAVAPVNISINSAGGSVGRFITDSYVTGGNVAAPVNVAIDTSHVTNPAPQLVYQTERWGPFSYTIPGFVPNAAYTVRLHFCENVKNGTGQRLFGVTIQGQSVLNNFDIFQQAGGQHVALVKEFNAVADATGTVNIAFVAGSADNPLVDGVEVLSNASTPGLTYQWYQGASGDTTTPITGATGTSYTTPPLNSATSYWVRVANSVGSTNSSTALISLGATASCPDYVVRLASDDGTGNTCGTLSSALWRSQQAAQPVTITFSLVQTNTILMTGPFSPTIRVGAGVNISGDGLGYSNNCSAVPAITINGAGITGDGLTLAGNNWLRNLRVSGFKGRQLVIPANHTGSVRLRCTILKP